MDTIINLLTSDGGALGVVFALLSLSFWVVNKISKITANHSAFSENVKKTESHIDEIRVDMAYLKGAIAQFMGASGDSVFKSHSPIALTEKGVAMSNEISANDILAINLDKIIKELESKQFKNAYDIQQYCMETAVVEPEKFFLSDDINKLKNYSYKKGIPFFTVGNLLGVMIRDAYFRHKNIPLDEVDECDPNK